MAASAITSGACYRYTPIDSSSPALGSEVRLRLTDQGAIAMAPLVGNRIEVVDVRDLGDLTLAAIRLRGHGAGSTAPTDNATSIVVRWRRGKVVWWRTFDVQAEALEAAGLSE